MADKVRIYPEVSPHPDGDGRKVYRIWVEFVKHGYTDRMLWDATQDENEFRTRYNALTVEKEPAPQEEEKHV